MITITKVGHIFQYKIALFDRKDILIDTNTNCIFNSLLNQNGIKRD